MKLINAINLKGAPVLVPDCPRNTIPEFCKEMGYKKGAEIGVYKGEFTELFCKEGIFMYAIDPWVSFGGQGRSQRRQDRQDFLYGHATRLLAPYKNKKIIRTTSMDALSFFTKESLDFVYLDGDHCFNSIVQDVWHWAHKVRHGGMIAGHDYFNTSPTSKNTVCNVAHAIDAYTKVAGVKNWYIFGEAINPIDKNDRYPSWMWVKP